MVEDLTPVRARLILAEPSVYADVAAHRLGALLMQAAAERKVVRLALSGGRGPRSVFQALARQVTIPWNRIEIFFADERAVPPDHEESNYRLVMDALVGLLATPPRAVHRMEAERPDLDAAARSYEALLSAPLDLLVLGIGEDGHTASLFPGHPEVTLSDRKVVPSTSPKPPANRLTITPPVIAEAGVRIMLAAGEAKAVAVQRACEGAFDPMACPAQLARDGIWIVDTAAASRLQTRPS